MPFVDAYAQRKKHEVMVDTWGHFYPEPGQKYIGEMKVAIGEYGDEIIVTSDFPKLNGSPQRYELEHTIFDKMRKFNPGIYKISCTLWFYKTCNKIYLGERLGKIINIKIEDV